MKTRNSSVAIGTQILECHFIIFGTQLTGVPPALSWHLTAAAFCLCGVESLGYRTLSIFKVCETEALASIEAPPSIIRQYKPRGTDALEAPRSIGAGTKKTDVGIFITLIYIDAVLAFYFIPWGTDTSERPLQILTGARRTRAGQGNTLISIYTVLAIWSKFITFIT